MKKVTTKTFAYLLKMPEKVEKMGRIKDTKEVYESNVAKVTEKLATELLKGMVVAAFENDSKSETPSNYMLLTRNEYTGAMVLSILFENGEVGFIQSSYTSFLKLISTYHFSTLINEEYTDIMKREISSATLNVVPQNPPMTANDLLELMDITQTRYELKPTPLKASSVLH